MKKRTGNIVWAVYFGLAMILQLTVPEAFHTDFFAFPVNAAMMLFAAVGLWILYRERPEAAPAVLLASPHTTFLLLSVSAVTFLVLGLTSRLSPASWWFFFLLTAFSAHLFAVILRRVKRGGPHRLRFVLNHAGLLLALAGGFAGSADTSVWRVRLQKDEVSRQAFASDGSSMNLKRELELTGFTVGYYPDGKAESYEASIRIDGEDAVLRVNEPCRLSFSEELYLVDYEHVPAGENAGYCILEIVRQPWKYIQWAGIWMMIAGSILLFFQMGQQNGAAADNRRAVK